MEKLRPEFILTILSILGIIGGFMMFVLGRILNDKKDKLTISFEIEKIKETLSEMKGDIEKIESIRRELDVISEKIKHKDFFT